MVIYCQGVSRKALKLFSLNNPWVPILYHKLLYHEDPHDFDDESSLLFMRKLITDKTFPHLLPKFIAYKRHLLEIEKNISYTYLWMGDGGM